MPNVYTHAKISNRCIPYFECDQILFSLDRDERDGIFGRETVYSQHDTDMLKRIIREKEQLEKQSTHKLALLQNQISSKDRDILRLEERLNEMVCKCCDSHYCFEF